MPDLVARKLLEGMKFRSMMRSRTICKQMDQLAIRILSDRVHEAYALIMDRGSTDALLDALIDLLELCDRRNVVSFLIERDILPFCGGLVDAPIFAWFVSAALHFNNTEAYDLLAKDFPDCLESFEEVNSLDRFIGWSFEGFEFESDQKEEMMGWILKGMKLLFGKHNEKYLVTIALDVTDPDLVKYLLKNYRDVDFAICYSGILRKSKQLLSMGLQDLRDTADLTDLAVFAICEGRFLALEYLLFRLSTLRIRINLGYLLRLACDQLACVPIIMALVDSGADVNATLGDDWYTADQVEEREDMEDFELLGLTPMDIAHFKDSNRVIGALRVCGGQLGHKLLPFVRLPEIKKKKNKFSPSLSRKRKQSPIQFPSTYFCEGIRYPHRIVVVWNKYLFLTAEDIDDVPDGIDYVLFPGRKLQDQQSGRVYRIVAFLGSRVVLFNGKSYDLDTFHNLLTKFFN